MTHKYVLLPTILISVAFNGLLSYFILKEMLPISANTLVVIISVVFLVLGMYLCLNVLFCPHCKLLLTRNRDLHALIRVCHSCGHADYPGIKDVSTLKEFGVRTGYSPTADSSIVLACFLEMLGKQYLSRMSVAFYKSEIAAITCCSVSDGDFSMELPPSNLHQDIHAQLKVLAAEGVVNVGEYASVSVSCVQHNRHKQLFILVS